MSRKITLRELEGNLNFFSKMYDVVRLIDPTRKEVLDCEFLHPQDIGTTCYNYWNRGAVCENCISMRAYRENKTFMKLENISKDIFLSIAIPIETDNDPVVLELLKKVTDTMMFGYGDFAKNELMYDVVADLNKTAMKDHLTGCYNRRFLDDRLSTDIVQATLNGSSLSIIFIDIDNMKTVNDNFGHSAGDKALKHVASILEECVHNEKNWVVRYGGDEFIICLNDTTAEQATLIQNQINNHFESKHILLKDQNVKISISMGLVTMDDKPYTAEEIIQMADRKMYESKWRNRSSKRPV
ncbi:GGDEF domain-containing protein [Scatolibacter rhodanostii]|uniref:GGDEF domain-containing protein n=1 Tax=Scatolibacter rhodanostii TaxID=2014781 RepID=UPI000C074036|nr:GGDEF domain-containing protein [Scatolibacter rhodanostii]